MFPAKVLNIIWPKQMADEFGGYKIVELIPLKITNEGAFIESNDLVLAIDQYEAALNDVVICGIGSRIREITSKKELPYKAFVLGIIDNIDIC